MSRSLVLASVFVLLGARLWAAPPGLAASYDFREGQGAVLHDVSGNGIMLDFGIEKLLRDASLFLHRDATVDISRFKVVKAMFLILSISSDWLYPSYQSKEIVEALSANDIDVRYCEIKSNYGHDSFLLESGQMNYTIQNFLSRTSVGDVMIKDVVTIRQGSSVEEAAGIMMTEGVTHLPVIARDGCLAGIVSFPRGP